MNEEFDAEQKTSRIIEREAFDWIESGIAAIVCVILIFTFVGRLVGVDGESMLPTLENGDRLIATHLMYKPERGDIVVVTKPNRRNEPLIKRVIATGGQTIDVDYENQTITVDGIVIDEELYLPEPMMDPQSPELLEMPVVVPEGHVFIMGDNRNNSWDSRFEGIGVIDERHILGKIIYRVMPYDAIGRPT